jgi:DNA topoisomerase VI subunit A
MFQDSKHLERFVLKRLLALVKQASGEQRDTDEEWLDLIGLARNPQYVYIKGHLKFRMEGGAWISLAKLKGGVGLSWHTVDQMTDLSTKAHRVITVENLTSYHQWLEQRALFDTEELVIYTGGFPHRILQHFLKSLSGVIEREGMTLQMLHWGNIDLGGIRIFQYLKSRLLPQLEPLWMDVGTLIRYERHTATITDEYASQIQNVLGDPQYISWVPVLKAMLERKIRLEQ